MKVDVNEAAPAFDEAGVGPSLALLNSVTLNTFNGQYLVILFVPAAFSSVCSIEVSEFNTAFPDFAAKNANILFVSPDSNLVQKAWLQAPTNINGLNLPGNFVSFAADYRFQMAKAYRTYVSSTATINRASVIIDAAGVVRYYAEQINGVKRTPAEILRLLTDIQTAEANGSAC